jgi:adenosyl cobinamide kinase/adenosyl cobinamide phosphate guanylyltransferase
MVAYEEVLPGFPAEPRTKQDILEYLRQAHGDIEDAKATLIFVAEEEGFDVEPEDVAFVTDEPPTSTFT